jgi:hypothetical protein
MYRFVTWYINITITILDITHRPVLYLKHGVSEIISYLRLQVESTQMGPTEVRIQRLALSIGPILIGTTWRRRQNPVSEMSWFKQKDNRQKDNVQNCVSYTNTVCYSYDDQTVAGLIAACLLTATVHCKPPQRRRMCSNNMSIQHPAWDPIVFVASPGEISTSSHQR